MIGYTTFDKKPRSTSHIFHPSRIRTSKRKAWNNAWETGQRGTKGGLERAIKSATGDNENQLRHLTLKSNGDRRATISRQCFFFLSFSFLSFFFSFFFFDLQSPVVSLKTRARQQPHSVVARSRSTPRKRGGWELERGRQQGGLPGRKSFCFLFLNTARPTTRMNSERRWIFTALHAAN